jgi:hypothetical protein
MSTFAGCGQAGYTRETSSMRTMGEHHVAERSDRVYAL